MNLAFDLLLMLALLWLAARALHVRDLFQGVVLFIAFGLLLALAWVRLRAPDVALAEAAIGSGLTGALLLATVGRLGRMDRAAGRDPAPAAAERIGWPLRLGTLIGAAFLVVALAAAVRAVPWQAAGLADAAHGRLAESGVTNPVTAVLLNFRAYDTLLEIGVLLLALAAVWAVARPQRDGEAEVAELEPARPQQRALVHLLVPVMILTAGHLLWIGAKAPGGAFQAGAVLGGAGVLLVLTRPGWTALRDRARLRALLAAGLAVFLLVGLLMLGRGARLLEYPAGAAGGWILVIEAAATVSIGLTLTLLFVGARPAEGREGRA